MIRRITGTLYNTGGKLLLISHCMTPADPIFTVTVEDGEYVDIENLAYVQFPLDGKIKLVINKLTPHEIEMIANRRRARHARMCKGKHNQRRPRR